MEKSEKYIYIWVIYMLKLKAMGIIYMHKDNGAQTDSFHKIISKWTVYIGTYIYI